MRPLEQQLALQRSAYGIDLPSLSGEERVAYVRMNVLAAVVELTEMLDEVDAWKAWQTERSAAGSFKAGDDGVRFANEGVDVLIFVYNLLNLLPWMDEDKLQALTYDKQCENKRRQSDGYAGKGDA